MITKITISMDEYILGNGFDLKNGSRIFKNLDKGPEFVMNIDEDVDSDDDLKGKLKKYINIDTSTLAYMIETRIGINSGPMTAYFPETQKEYVEIINTTEKVWVITAFKKEALRRQIK